MLAATTTPRNLHLAEEKEDEDEMVNGNGSNDLSRDLEIDDTIKDPVEDRLTLAERNERLHDQLKVGSQTLRATTMFGSAVWRMRLAQVGGAFFTTNTAATVSTQQTTKVFSKKAGRVVDSHMKYAARLCLITNTDANDTDTDNCNVSIINAISKSSCMRTASFKCKLGQFVVRLNVFECVTLNDHY